MYGQNLQLEVQTSQIFYIATKRPDGKFHLMHGDGSKLTEFVDIASKKRQTFSKMFQSYFTDIPILVLPAMKQSYSQGKKL